MKQIYAIVLGIISFIGLLPGCVDDPEMDTHLQNAKAPACKTQKPRRYLKLPWREK